MHKTLYLEIAGCVSEEGFSLDELVIRTKELFAEEGMAGLVGLILSLVDEHISLGLVSGKSAWRPERCCEACRYEFYSRSDRRFRTSVGVVRMRWRVLRCAVCGRSIVPLREFLGVKRYQSKATELERIVVEVVSEQSYRRASRHMGLIGEIPVPKSTAHRWVAESECDEIKTEDKTVETLLSDGTGYKRRPSPKEGKDNQGEIRIAVGVKATGAVVPFGAWSGESWEEIGRQIKERRDDAGPIAKVLVSDGEPGLAEGLAHLANEAQRCHWHIVHDLDSYMWQDKASKEERRGMQRRMAGIIGIELPAQDFEAVSAEDRAKLLESTNQAEERVDELIEDLCARGYRRAGRYVRRAKENLFTYVRFWLRYGLVSPRASSMIERMMREIGRRLKAIAFGWSEAGAARMARIIIKRITSAGEWETYWRERLRITGGVVLIYRGAHAA